MNKILLMITFLTISSAYALNLSEGCEKDCKEHTKSDTEFQNCYTECLKYRDPYLADVSFKCDDTGCYKYSTMPKPSRHRKKH